MLELVSFSRRVESMQQLEQSTALKYLCQTRRSPPSQGQILVGTRYSEWEWTLGLVIDDGKGEKNEIKQQPEGEEGSVTVQTQPNLLISGSKNNKKRPTNS